MTYHRYIKGRISYDQVNNAIDEIHKVVTAKYKILRLPRSAMGEPVMKKYKVCAHSSPDNFKWFKGKMLSLYTAPKIISR